MCAVPLETSLEDWNSNPGWKLVDLDPKGRIQYVECLIYNSDTHSNKDVIWRASRENDEFYPQEEDQYKPPAHTIEKLAVKGHEMDGSKLDQNIAALLMEFLSGTPRVCNHIQLDDLIFPAELNIGCLPFTIRMTFSSCTFETGSCFFNQLSYSELGHNTLINFAVGKKREFDVLLDFLACNVPDDLDISLLKEIPRIVITLHKMEKSTAVTLEWLKLLQENLVNVTVIMEVDSIDTLEQGITSCCTLLEESTVLTDLSWTFNLSGNAPRNARMNPEQQKRLFDAAGRARSPVLKSLTLYSEILSHLFLKREILLYTHTWSRMKRYFALIGCSEENSDWMRKRIQSDRYRLGPVLYAPFCLPPSFENGNKSGFVSCLNIDIIRNLVENYLSIGDDRTYD